MNFPAEEVYDPTNTFRLNQNMVFVARGGGLEPELRGNIEEIDTAPRFVAKDRAGHVLAEKSWGEGPHRVRRRRVSDIRFMI